MPSENGTTPKRTKKKKRRKINKMKQKLLIFAMSACFALIASAQESKKVTHVQFRVGSSNIEQQFAGNAEKLSSLVSHLQEVNNDHTLYISSIEFRGNSSPEGGVARNKQLASQRMKALESYVRSKVQIPEELIKRVDLFIDWNHLAEMVEASDLAQKDDVLRIIRQENANRQQALMNLNGGKTWAEMNRRFFGEMRNACAIVVTYRKAPAPAPTPQPEPAPVVEEPAPAPAPQPEPEPVVEDTRKPLYMAIKTNLLYDAAIIPNIGLEVSLGKQWSMAGNWFYTWFKNDHKKDYWRGYGGELEVRKWFGAKAQNKPLTGHHLGVYLQGLTYDVEFGNTGNLSDFSYGAGISYGYSAPIARRLNLDFVIGVGYFGGEYKEYIPIDSHYVWQATKNRHWFGPTKAEVTLVWLIGHGNYNTKKGGKR